MIVRLGLVLALLVQSDPLEGDLGKLHRELRVPRTGVWGLPWKLSLADARRQAVQERKPIFLCLPQGGNLLGVAHPSGIMMREVALNDPEVLRLLSSRFVPAALAVEDYQERKDEAGDFYRRATQGIWYGQFAFTASGEPLGRACAMHDAKELRDMLKGALEKFQPAAAPDAGPAENPKHPEGGLVLIATSKILGGKYPERKVDERDRPFYERFDPIYRSALRIDRLWVRKDEAVALADGKFPESLARRLAVYHLAIPGEGYWARQDVKTLAVDVVQGRLKGICHLETPQGFVGFRGELTGAVETKGGRVSRLDVLVKGMHWGARLCGDSAEGQKDPHNHFPLGEFPVAFAFALAGPEEGLLGEVTPSPLRNLAEYLK